MGKKTTQELFSQLQDRLILPLEGNEITCPICKGLRMILKQNNENEGHIENCHDCYNGKLYVCKYCGKANKTDHCDCKEAQEERDNEFKIKLAIKEQELFKKSKKIKFDDYDGYFILDDDEHVKDIDDVYNRLYDKIKYEHATDEDLPRYLWATSSEPVFDLNIYDIILDKTEDGYDDMYSYLDMDNSEDLERAQEYLDEWYKKQGDCINTYYEDNTTAVLLNDVIKEIREKIRKEEENN